MKNRAFATRNQSADRPANVDAEIQSLARATDMPVELVQEIYTSERAKLEQQARIKTYIPVLIHRHVKALLREQRTSSYGPELPRGPSSATRHRPLPGNKINGPSS